MAEFEINDRRGIKGPSAAESSSRAVANLRSRGFALPESNIQAKKIAKEVETSVHNRTLAREMRRTGSVTRTAAGDAQMAIPKVREPLSSLKDKNIPFDTTKPKELIEIRKWARLFYSTHDLIPLLVDIYSKFPLVGLEFKSKDPLIKEFYESMFMDQLDYDTFLQDLGREFFISGEVNSLAHFDEALGVWSSEEILNPDVIHVSKSLFVQRERVQLLVKELVDSLRSTDATADSDLTRSEQMEKRWQYEQLNTYYPEIINAAALDEGLDISDALISRMVNKVQPWDLRGTPHLLRSFRTLMMEESLNAAQDAVADRLYSPFILATLGVPNLGDGEPWIPDQIDLDETRDMMQEALAADFRLLVHNFGLQVTSVFGRESVPRFDQDYARIDRKLMQAWGIGEALISGSSTGAGRSTYAGSALNREFVTLMMTTFQKAIKKHVKKRCEVIAEAQEHFDYDLKGGVRKPIYREIVEIDEETGAEYTRKVPKLLIPELEMSTLNLRDEAQERQFLQTLKQSGVPISDNSLSVNIPIDFEEELEHQSEEKVQKLLAEAQAMKKAFDLIEAQGLPIPPDLAKYMAATYQLEKEQTSTKTEETRQQVFEETGVDPANPPQQPGSPAIGPDGQPLPGQPGQPGQPPHSEGDKPFSSPVGGNGQQPPQPNKPNNGQRPFSKLPNGQPIAASVREAEFPNQKGGGDNSSSGSSSSDSSNPFGISLDNGISQNQLDNSKKDPNDPDITDRPPINIPIDGLEPNQMPKMPKAPSPRNRTRPEESDEGRSTAPKRSSLGDPSSFGASLKVDEQQVESAVKRLGSDGPVEVRELVATDEFFDVLNRQSYMDQIRNDIDSIYLSMQVDRDGIPRISKRAEKDEALKDSFMVLCEMVDQYEEVYGFRPEW